VQVAKAACVCVKTTSDSKRVFFQAVQAVLKKRLILRNRSGKGVTARRNGRETLLESAACKEGDGFASRSRSSIPRGCLAEARLTPGLTTQPLWGWFEAGQSDEKRTDVVSTDRGIRRAALKSHAEICRSRRRRRRCVF